VAPKVAIIILNWNNYADTKECLESLENLTYQNYEIIVVDNGSTDGSAARLQAEFPQHKFIKNEENLGFAGGNNLGIRYAWKRGAEYFWILNNDTIVAPGALTALVTAVKGDSSIGIAGSRILDYQHPERTLSSGGVMQPWKGTAGGHSRGFQDDNDQWLEVDCVSGSSMLVNRMAVKAVGLLDERYFLCVEEVDWCMRMRREGWKVVYVPSSKVWHKVSQTIGGSSPLMYYYMTRNQLLFFAQYFPSALPFALARSVLRMIRLLGLRRWAQFRAAFRGCLDWGMGRYGAYGQHNTKGRRSLQNSRKS